MTSETRVNEWTVTGVSRAQAPSFTAGIARALTRTVADT